MKSTIMEHLDNGSQVRILLKDNSIRISQEGKGFRIQDEYDLEYLVQQEAIEPEIEILLSYYKDTRPLMIEVE